MNRLKRILCLVLAGSLLLCFGCAAPAQPGKPDAANTLTDAAGREIPIPENKESLTIASAYAVSVPFLVALGLEDQVVAINCKSRFWTESIPALDAAGSVGRGVVDLEALASYAPSVLIHRANDPKTLEAVTPLGVEVICIQAETMEDVKAMLTLLGRYFGKEDRAAEVIGYVEKKYAYIDSIVAQIPEAERPTALLMGGEPGRIAGSDMIQSWMIEKAGGICVAVDVVNNSNWADVGVETVFSYNPEYLFLTSSTSLDYTAQELLEDPNWSAMTAIAQGHVWQVPSRLDCWDMPGVVSVLGTMWMLNKMHPEHFTTEQLQQEIDEYYRFFFGQTFDAGYLDYEL